MATIVRSFAISGIEAYTVDIEVKTMDGIPSIAVIGLGDQAVREAAPILISRWRSVFYSRKNASKLKMYLHAV